jgi:hypothetical protein
METRGEITNVKVLATPAGYMAEVTFHVSADTLDKLKLLGVKKITIEDYE